MRLNKDIFETTVFIAREKVDGTPYYDELFEVINPEEIYMITKDRIEQKESIFRGYEERVFYPINRKDVLDELNSLTDSAKMKSFRSKITRENYYVGKDYWACPSCKRFHPVENYVNPLCGWNEMIRKHASEIIAQRNIEGIYESCVKIKRTPKQIILDAVRMSYIDEIEYTNANKIFSNSFWLNVSSEEFECDEEGVVIFRCPTCKNIIPMIKGSVITTIDPSYRYLALYRNEKWYDYNTMDANYEIFVDGSLVTLSIISWHLYPNIKGKLHIEGSCRRATFNTKTGQSYMFREFDMKTHKPIFRDLHKPKIRNFTYSDNLWMDISKEIADEVSSKICEVKGIPVIKCSEVADEFNSIITKLATINRFGYLGKECVSAILMSEDSLKLSSRKKTELLKLSSNQELFLKKIKREKVTGKKRIKLYAKNPWLFVYEPYLTKIGFKDNNVLLSLIENPILISKIISEFHITPFDTKNTQNIIISNLQKFVCDYASIKSEAELVRKLKEFQQGEFKDTARMYVEIISTIDISNEQKRILFSGSIHDIHNKLMDIVSFIDTDAFYIPYTHDEMRLNCRCGNYTFTLAKTNFEMKDVGNTMHICVGSYAESAFRKSCLIVFMRDEKKQLAACIELNSSGEHLCQIKDYCNEVLKEEKRIAARTFLEKNKIDFSNCRDANNSKLATYEERSSYVQIRETEGYMIFDDKSEFKKVVVPKQGEETLIDVLKTKYREEYYNVNAVEPFVEYGFDADDGPFI